MAANKKYPAAAPPGADPFPYPIIQDGATWANNYDGTADGTRVSVGTTGIVWSSGLCALNDTQVLLTYGLSGNTVVEMWTRSGTSISQTAKLTLSGGGNVCGVARLTNDTAIVAAGNTTGTVTAWHVTAGVGSPILTAGTAETVHTGSNAVGAYPIPVSATKVIVGVMEEGTSTGPYSYVVDVSGTTLTAGTQRNIKAVTGSGANMMAGCRLDGNHAIFSFTDAGATSSLVIINDQNQIIAGPTTGVSDSFTEQGMSRETIGPGVGSPNTQHMYMVWVHAADRDPRVKGVAVSNSGSPWTITQGTAIDDTLSGNGRYLAGCETSADGYVFHAFANIAGSDAYLAIRDFAGTTQTSLVSQTNYDTSAGTNLRGQICNQTDDYIISVVGTAPAYIEVLTHGV